MTYAAIIKGARGINYFGGTIQSDASPPTTRNSGGTGPIGTMSLNVSSKRSATMDLFIPH